MFKFSPKQRSKLDLSNLSVSRNKRHPNVTKEANLLPEAEPALSYFCPKQNNSTRKIFFASLTFKRNRHFLVSNYLPETEFKGALDFNITSCLWISPVSNSISQWSPSHCLSLGSLLGGQLRLLPRRSSLWTSHPFLPQEKIFRDIKQIDGPPR